MSKSGKALDLELRAKFSEVEIARSGNRPQVQLNASFSRFNKEGDFDEVQKRNVGTLGLELSLPLDVSGSTSRKTDTQVQNYMNLTKALLEQRLQYLSLKFSLLKTKYAILGEMGSLDREFPFLENP